MHYFVTACVTFVTSLIFTVNLFFYILTELYICLTWYSGIGIIPVSRVHGSMSSEKAIPISK